MMSSTVGTLTSSPAIRSGLKTGSHRREGKSPVDVVIEHSLGTMDLFELRDHLFKLLLSRECMHHVITGQ